jgi:hypothetical protein
MSSCPHAWEPKAWFLDGQNFYSLFAAVAQLTSFPVFVILGFQLTIFVYFSFGFCFGVRGTVLKNSLTSEESNDAVKVFFQDPHVW